MKTPPSKPLLSRRGVARLAYSLSAAQLADQARSQVSTENDAWGGKPGDYLDAAMGLVSTAQTVLERAIILERERGTSWAELGETMGISKQAAQQRYGEIVDAWQEDLDRVMTPSARGFTAALVPNEGGERPEEHAHRLDQWTLRHADKTRSKRPVSDGLEQAGVIQQMNELTRFAGRMPREKSRELRRAFHTAKLTVLTRAADEDPRNTSMADAVAGARAQLAALDSEEVPAKGKRNKPSVS